MIGIKGIGAMPSFIVTTFRNAISCEAVVVDGTDMFNLTKLTGDPAGRQQHCRLCYSLITTRHEKNKILCFIHELASIPNL